MDDTTAKSRLTRLESLIGEIRDAAGYGLDADGNPTTFDEAALATAVGKVRAAADRVEEVVSERTTRQRHVDAVRALQPGDSVQVPLIVGASTDGWVRQLTTCEVVGVNESGRRPPQVVVRVPLPAVVAEHTFPADAVRFD